MGAKPLTPPQQALIRKIEGGDCYVRGPEIRTARTLVALGVLTLEDNGDLRPGRRVDGERWSAALVPGWTWTASSRGRVV